MKIRLLYLSWISICLLSLSEISAQNAFHRQIRALWQLADSLKDEKAFEQAFDVMDEALRIQETRNDQPMSDIGYSHLLKGRIYLLTDYCALGEPHLAKAIEIFTQLDSAEYLYRSMSRMAELHKILGDYETSNFYYQQIIDLAPKYWDAISAKAGVAYGNIGFNYFYLEDYETCRSYIQKYRQILEAALPEFNMSLAKCYSNCGSIYWQMNQLEEAEDYYLKCLNIYQNLLPDDDKHFLELYNNLGGLHLSKSDTTQALHFYSQAIQIEKRITGEPEDSLQYLNGDFDVAQEYYQRTLRRRREMYGVLHPSTLGCYLYIGDAQLKQGLTAKALESYHIIVDGLTPHIPLATVYDQPEEFSHIDDEPLLLKAITRKAKAFWQLYRQTGDKEALHHAFSSYMIASELIDQIRRGYKTEPSYLFWTQNLKPIYDEAVSVSYELWTQTGSPAILDSAFSLAEKSRSFSLKLGLRDQKAMSFSHISPEFLESEANLKKQLNEYHQAILQEKSKGNKADPQKLNILSDAKLSLEKEYRALIKQLEQDYPSYYNLKYHAPALPTASVQKTLSQQEAILIEYVWSNDEVYALYISPRNKAFLKLGSGNTLEEAIQLMRKSISDWTYFTQNPSRAYSDYLQSSTFLYQKLISPIDSLLAAEDSIKRMIISPDGMLGYLPFDLLLTHGVDSINRNYQTLPYLLKKYAVSYVNSASLLIHENKDHLQAKPLYSFLGFAPKYDNGQNQIADQRQNLSRLAYNEQEVENAAKIWGGKYLSGSKANEAHFYRYSPKAVILHLAMHAFVNDTNPQLSGLAFGKLRENEPPLRDDYLYAYELYNLSLSAQLTVLSACNTGLGKWIQGEGMMSISRGFQYTGCNSIMYSLWQMDDKATADLIQEVYVNLETGLPKDIALQKAKIAFLSSADPVISHPYYWGGLTLIGSTTPLDLSDIGTRTYYWLAVILAFFLTGVSFYFIRAKRSRIASR